MDKTVRLTISPFNPGEAKSLKAEVYDLSEGAAKQALYGIINVLSLRVNMPKSFFKELIDDATKYNKTEKGGLGG